MSTRDAADNLRARLEADRKTLIDLSLRNPLLNYRPRVRGLECAGGSPPDLFRRLVIEGKSLTFLPAAGSADEPAPPVAERFSLLSPPSDSPRDLTLPTALPPEELQSRLLAVHYSARTSVEETGVNTLFLALGLLNWSEADAADRRLQAPLVLVPVVLDRTRDRSRFLARHDGGEITANLALAEKLKSEFGLALPELPDPEDLDLGGYFDELVCRVAAQASWKVDRDAVVLGFFSFSKFLMYRDLDDAVWPTSGKPGEHPIVKSLLGEGFGALFPALDDEPIERHPALGDLRLVVDADGTQTRALLDVADGRHLVVQGPPGTGKSQTITNLIAGAVGRGQTVLFVAEKRAALEVVRRRLESVGLGPACLELHSHKMSKKVVLEQIGRALETARPSLNTALAEEDLRHHEELRHRLDDYAEALHEPIGASGVTPEQAIGGLLRIRSGLEGIEIPPLELPALSCLTAAQFRSRLEQVAQLQDRVGAIGGLSSHPFRGSRRLSLLPGDDGALRELLKEAKRATAALREASSTLSRFLRLPPASNHAGCAVLQRAARRASEADRWQGVQVRGEWTSRRDDLRELIEAGRALADLRRRFDPVLLRDAWGQDLTETRQALNARGRSWWTALDSEHRRASLRLASICRAAPPADLDDQLEWLDAVIEARRLSEIVNRHETLAARLFGRRWRGEESDWPALAEMTESIEGMHRDARSGLVPRGLIDFVAEAPALAGLETLTRALETGVSAHQTAIGRLLDSLELDESARFGAAAGLAEQAFEAQEGVLDDWSRRPGALDALIGFNRVAEQCRAQGLEAVVKLAETTPEAGGRLVDLFVRSWYEGLIRRACQESEVLRDFDGNAHLRAIRTFRDLDRQILVHERSRVALAHWQRLPRYGGGGELAILRRELVKKSRLLPVRQLLDRAGRVVRSATPVFMMSPLSVAAFIAPGAIEFDLVVFDEASQVRPVDALGALLRGRQAVVVGDSRQLPPTRFFDRLTGGEEGDDEDETTADVESLLDLFVAQGAPERMLRWHYRSRHESLIAVSNREFYDGRLIVFPSPDAGRRDSGLVLVHLPRTTYDRGGTRTNQGEAEAVARAALEHARAQLGRPAEARLTLGVVALSSAQRQAIHDHFERLRRHDPSCDSFLASDQAEPFFIKNLENVQGDERDVIYVSVGYGRTAEGTLALNFGPLNASGGERRLNVLFTRARRRCVVFSNLTAEDVDPGRARSRGVLTLRTFLAAAATGASDLATHSVSEINSSFSSSVREALTAGGWDVRARVGAASSALDLAVVDPDQPDRYLLGMICDGPNDRNAGPARDRERLRPQVLEALGWRLHRAFGPAWLHDCEGERARLLAAVAAARGD